MNDFLIELNRQKARDVLGLLDAAVWLMQDIKLSADDYTKFAEKADDLSVSVMKAIDDVQILESESEEDSP